MSGKNEEIVPFPQLRQRRLRPKKKVIPVNTIPLYCTCRMPETDDMIQCSQCMNWFHISCVKPPQQAIDEFEEKWYSSNCSTF